MSKPEFSEDTLVLAMRKIAAQFNIVHRPHVVLRRDDDALIEQLCNITPDNVYTDGAGIDYELALFIDALDIEEKRRLFRKATEIFMP
jgi:hypothetical protein